MHHKINKTTPKQINEKIKYKKPQTLQKPPEKKLSINEIVSECKKIGISYGQFQALRKEQEQANKPFPSDDQMHGGSSFGCLPKCFVYLRGKRGRNG